MALVGIVGCTVFCSQGIFVVVVIFGGFFVMHSLQQFSKLSANERLEN